MIVRSASALLLVAGLSLSVSACSGDDAKDDNTQGTTQSTSAAPSGEATSGDTKPAASTEAGKSGDADPKSGATDTEPANTTITASPNPSYSQPTGAIKEVDATCTEDKAGAWSMTGTVTNKGDKNATYTVRAAVIVVEGSTVQGSKEVKVELAPGKSKDVAAKAFYKTPKGAKTLSCVVSATKE